MLTYAQARSDFEYLESLAELNDQVELDSDRLDLMQNPTKETAKRLYMSGIRLWFLEHDNRFADDARAAEIFARYF